jgi:hypothetical protein
MVQVAVVSILSSVLLAMGAKGMARAMDAHDIGKAVSYHCIAHTGYPGRRVYALYNLERALDFCGLSISSSSLPAPPIW